MRVNTKVVGDISLSCQTYDDIGKFIRAIATAHRMKITPPPKVLGHLRSEIYHSELHLHRSGIYYFNHLFCRHEAPELPHAIVHGAKDLQDLI